MRYLIAIPIQESEATDFIALRDKYKKMAPRWKITLGPHITVFRPSEHKLAQAEAIKIFKSAPRFEIFTQRFDGFESFMNYSNNAVYSEPVDHAKFHDIRETYLPIAEKICQDITEVWPFHPHLTLVNRLDKNEAIKLMGLLKKGDFSKSYTMSRICLYKKDKSDANWVEIACNRLK